MLSKTNMVMYSCLLTHKVAVVDLPQLRHFQAVARHQHVSRAAAELRVAQPALSRSIARLEAELGVALFDRRGRRVRLNRFGALFLARVQNALGELDQARQELRDAAGLARGTVAVAVETLRMVTELAAGFLADHPEVSLRLYQSPAPVMSAQLQAGEVDLCLASQPLAGPRLQAAEILSEEVLLAVPPGHPLAARTRVGIEALAGEPFVTTRPGYWQRALADRLFAAAGIQPAIVCEGDEPYAVRSLISAGVGVGLIPAVARRAAPHPPVAWLHLDAPGCRRTLSLVWRTDAYRSAAARAFTEFAAARAWPSDA
jgi:DNA-binding transcriptional LysR family regulator